MKTHHNVGGLPEDIQFELVEPLRDLYKDEVKIVGECLGVRERSSIQALPGPGVSSSSLGRSDS